jgi:hypothetical protein
MSEETAMIRLFVPLMLVALGCCYSAEIGPEDRQNILDIMGSGAHDGDPKVPEYVTTYAKQHGLRQRDVESFLLSLVKTYAKDGAPKCVFGLSAIGLLVAYRSQWTLPELEALLPGSGEIMHDTLIRGIVQIGGPTLPQFARKMFDPAKTPRMDRHALYEELSAYVGVDTVRPQPLPDNKSKDPALKDEIMQLLKMALTTEPDPFHRKRIRAILVAAGVDPASLPKEEAGAQSPEATPKKDQPPPQAKATPVQAEVKKPVEPLAAEPAGPVSEKPAAPASVRSILPVVVLVLLVVGVGAVILIRRRHNP